MTNSTRVFSGGSGILSCFCVPCPQGVTALELCAWELCAACGSCIARPKKFSRPPSSISWVWYDQCRERTGDSGSRVPFKAHSARPTGVTCWDVASSQTEENASNWLLAVAPAVNLNQPLRESEAATQDHSQSGHTRPKEGTAPRLVFYCDGRFGVVRVCKAGDGICHTNRTANMHAGRKGQCRNRHAVSGGVRGG